jgi:hypothetical protein
MAGYLNVNETIITNATVLSKQSDNAAVVIHLNPIRWAEKMRFEMDK